MQTQIHTNPRVPPQKTGNHSGTMMQVEMKITNTQMQKLGIAVLCFNQNWQVLEEKLDQQQKQLQELHLNCPQMHYFCFLSVQPST